MPQYSTAVRNAQGDGWEAAMGASVRIQLWSGPAPASCALAATGTKLAEFQLVSDWSPAAVAGVKTLAGLPLTTTSSASGQAGYYRITDSAAAVCHEQGTVDIEAADMIIDDTSLLVGQPVQITAFAKQWPGA